LVETKVCREVVPSPPQPVAIVDRTAQSGILTPSSTLGTRVFSPHRSAAIANL
jgi:hypothetical protein